MKMLLIVYNKILEPDIHRILERGDIHSYTETPKVFGAGEAGKLEDSRHRPGYNGCIFAAVPDQRTTAVAAAFHEFSEAQKREYGRDLGLRVFVIPCEQLV